MAATNRDYEYFPRNDSEKGVDMYNDNCNIPHKKFQHLTRF